MFSIANLLHVSVSCFLARQKKDIVSGSRYVIYYMHDDFRESMSILCFFVVSFSPCVHHVITFCQATHSQ